MIWRVLLGLIITIVTVSGAASAAGNKAVYGAGMISCADWVRYRSIGDKPNSYQAQAWVDGFLSGYNVADDANVNFLEPSQSTIARYAWIDNYCGPKPLDNLVQAVIALKNELLVRAGGKSN
jgi:hypothetical protein